MLTIAGGHTEEEHVLALRKPDWYAVFGHACRAEGVWACPVAADLHCPFLISAVSCGCSQQIQQSASLPQLAYQKPLGAAKHGLLVRTSTSHCHDHSALVAVEGAEEQVDLSRRHRRPTRPQHLPHHPGELLVVHRACCAAEVVASMAV